MALLIKARPVVGSTLRYLLANSSKTFTSRTHMSSPSSVSFIGYRSVVAEKQYRYYPLINSNQIRLSSNEVAVEAKTNDSSILETQKSSSSQQRTPVHSIRTLDRAFISFEERSQRNERVAERDFIKTFDLFTKVVEGLGNDVSRTEPEVASNIILYTNILLRCCGRLMVDTPPKGRELLVGNLWTFIKDRSISIDISHYNSLLRVMNENETVYDPMKIFQEISGHNLNADRITYQRLIHQYCLQGDITGATSLLEKMKDSGMEMNEQIFASLIIGYFKQENPPSIDEMFDLMRTNGVDPNSSSYAAAFVSVARRLDKDPQAVESFEQLCKLFAKDEVQLSPNDLCDVTVALSPLRSTNESVNKFLENIADTLTGSVSSRYRFLTALLRANHFEHASKLFWSQKVNDRTLKTGNVGVYWIRALAVNRNVPIEFAINECRMLRDREYNFRPFHQLYFTAAEIGRVDMIRPALKIITETEPLKIHYVWPLIAQAKDENEIVQVLKNDLNPLMNSSDLLETFSNWIWPKFSNSIERLFELNKELGYDSNILMASFLNYSVQENKFMEALKFISEAPQDVVSATNNDQQEGDDDGVDGEVQMIPRARSNDGGDLVSRLLNQIAEQTKDSELVKKAFSMCQVPGQPIATRSLAALVRVHLLNNDYDAGLEEFLKIAREHRVAPCRAELMKHCLITKNPEKLQKIMNCTTDIFGEQNSLFDLAVCCLKSGKLKQAQKIFASPGFRVRPVRVYQTCRSMARQGDVDVLENFVSLTRDMYDVNQEYLYQILIDTYERTSNAKRALHLWNMMQEEEFQPSKRSLVMIANILERNNIEVPFQKPKASYLEQGNIRRSAEPRESEI